MFSHAGPAPWDLAALADHARAVGVFKFDEMMVENLAVTFGVADLPSAHALRANRVGAFDPVTDVDVVDVLLDDVIAGKPGEIIPVADLVMHLRLARQPFNAVP